MLFFLFFPIDVVVAELAQSIMMRGPAAQHHAGLLAPGYNILKKTALDKYFEFQTHNKFFFLTASHNGNANS